MIATAIKSVSRTESATDEYLTLSQASKHFPKVEGRYPSLQAVKRRILKGAFGIRLKAIKSGRRWLTTEQWIRAFEAAVTAKALPESEQDHIVSEFQSRLAQARLLQEHGIDVSSTRSTHEE